MIDKKSPVFSESVFCMLVVKGDSCIHKLHATAGDPLKQLVVVRSHIIPDVCILCVLNRLLTHYFNTDGRLFVLKKELDSMTAVC